ncbi:hypothetical protein FOZ62_031265, partial [Perkinsus olseni]
NEKEMEKEDEQSALERADEEWRERSGELAESGTKEWVSTQMSENDERGLAEAANAPRLVFPVLQNVDTTAAEEVDSTEKGIRQRFVREERMMLTEMCLNVPRRRDRSRGVVTSIMALMEYMCRRRFVVMTVSEGARD